MQTIDYEIKTLLNILGPCEQIGQLPEGQHVIGVAALNRAQTGDLSFLGNTKYKNEVPATRASVVLLPLDYGGQPQTDQLYLKIKDPSEGLAKICAHIERSLRPEPLAGIHPSAYVDPSAVIDPTATVGPMCVVSAHAHIGAHTVLQAHVCIGAHVYIGDHCHLFPNVTVVDHCVVGNRVVLHPGVVIGSDGFGFATQNGSHTKIPQIGNVVVEDDVEIGANTTVDRARLHETRIGAGTKIDNLVQIAHNVTIGKNCLIVALVGIAGSTQVGDNVVIGGQSGIAGHLTIGANSIIGGQSGVNGNIPEKSYVRGAPALPYLHAHKVDALKRHLPDLFKRVQRLEQQLKPPAE